MRSRRELQLKNCRFIVGPGDESNFRIEISFGYSVAGINIKPVVRISESSAKSCIVPGQAQAPRLYVVTPKVQIVEQYELGIESPGAVIGIERIPALFVSNHRSDI